MEEVENAAAFLKSRLSEVERQVRLLW